MAFPITPSVGDKHVVGSVSYEWNGYAWDAAAVTGAVSITKYEYTATGGQTVFAAAGYRNKKYVDVYVNGMKLSETDYAAADNATVVLNVGATVSDLVVIEVSDAVIMADIIKTVNATTLASGASATVNYVDGALEFGIPAGGITQVQLDAALATVETAIVAKPVITSPTSGTVDYIGAITATYATAGTYAGGQDYVKWEAATDIGFTAIVASYEGSSNLTSWTPAVALPLATVYVRVKMGSDGHRSVWSDTINFVTPNIYVQTPTMTVTGTPADVQEQPTLSTSAFAVFNGSDTHASTDWVITQGGTEVWSSMADTVNKTSIVVPASELVVNTAYVFKARHNGTTYGSSGWVEVSGTTKTSFTQAYGVEWNHTTDTYTRTGLAVGTANSTSYAGSLQLGMRRCVLNANGTVNYYLHPTDSTKKADGSAAVIDGSAGNVMVEIPKFYYKYEYTAPVHKWSISPLQEAGYTVHPAFIRSGVEKDYRYYPAYEGYNLSGKLISGSGRVPTVSQTRAAFRTQAAQNGTGWSQIDWNLLTAVQLLFLTEYADFDTQAMIGNGNDTGSDYTMTTGGSNSIGNASSPATNDNTWMSYRGIENWYASMWKFIDGVNVQERLYYVNNNPATFADDVFTGDYVSTGITSATTNGYVSNLVASGKGFVASAVTGSNSTYVPDYFYQTTGDVTVLFGGNASGGLRGGGFCLYAYGGSSYSDASLGSAVSF